MRKIILVVVLILCLALAFSSCKKKCDGHVYDNCADTECNNCGEERTAIAHTYDSCTDTDCNVCGDVRSDSGHVYDNCADIDCNVCGEERAEATHTYNSCDDTACSVCGEEREAVAHDITTVEAQAPTCSAVGWNAYEKCTNCSYSTYAENELAIVPTAHAYDNCEDTVCNHCSQVRTVEHDVTEIARVESTCTVAGTDKYFKCNSCGKIFANVLATEVLDEVPALELAPHSLVNHDGLAATCVTNGYNAYKTCNNCDYSTYSEIKATGHSGTIVPAQAPTCTEGGWEQYEKCTNAGCGYVEEHEEYKALGHSYEDKAGLDPTCETAGYTAYKECSVCNDTQDKVTRPATGHTYSETYAKDASYHWNPCHCGDYTEKLVHTFTNGVCVCGLNESEFVYPCEHTSKTYHEKVVATCTTTGTEEYYQCDDPACNAYINASGNVISKPVVIPKDANNHDLKTIEAQAPTCVATGWNAYVVCQRDGCSHSTYDENILPIDPDAHNLENVAAKAPTCTDNGWEAYQACTNGNCEHTVGYQAIAATGHKYTHSCDATCDNGCNYTRPESELVHVYAHDCDATCDNEGCNYTRPETELVHEFTHDCDTTCNREGCGYTRPESDLEHSFSHSCDATCEREGCNYTRPESELEHVYSNGQDTTCNNCGEEREVDNDGTTLPEHNFG